MTLPQPSLRADSHDNSDHLAVTDRRRKPSNSVSSHDTTYDDFNPPSALRQPSAATTHPSTSQTSLAPASTPSSTFTSRRRSMREKLRRQARRSVSDTPLNDSECPSSASSRHPSISRSMSPATSRKRNQDFHELFRSVPSDEPLIEDCSCALQRDIILAGRLYISEKHVCFTSNIFGFVTTLVFAFSEIVAFEKEATAMVFPNAISIQTKNSRNTFRSFISRDLTYDLLVSVWHADQDSKKPLRPVPNLYTSDSDVSDPSEVASLLSGSDAAKSYDSSEEDSHAGLMPPSACSDIPLVCVQSASSNPDVASAPKVISNNSLPVSDSATTLSPPTSYFTAPGAHEDSQLGPAAHPPTDFPHPSARYDRVIKEAVIPAPLGQVYSLLHGPNSAAFLSDFLSQNQKVVDLQMDDADEKDGLCPAAPSRTISYIKPLNGVVGPKQTKCILTETLDYYDLELAVVVTATTLTPDVPSGNVFSVKNKVLLTWAENNATRFLATGTVEWTGRSFFKGLIERGSTDGQLAYMEDLIPALADEFTKSPNYSHTPSPKSKQEKRKRKQGRNLTARGAGGVKSVQSRRQGKSVQTNHNPRGGTDAGTGADTGPFALSLNTVQFVFATLKSILFLPFNGKASMLVLGIVLMALGSLITLRRMEPTHTPQSQSQSQPQSQSSSSSSSGDNLMDTARDRFYMYETMWRHQESELWDWLEERLGYKKNPLYANFGRPWYGTSSSGSGSDGYSTPHGAHEQHVMDDRQIEEEIERALVRLQTLQAERERRQKAPRQP